MDALILTNAPKPKSGDGPIHLRAWNDTKSLERLRLAPQPERRDGAGAEASRCERSYASPHFPGFLISHFQEIPGRIHIAEVA
jgi:hypothetical protein